MVERTAFLETIKAADAVGTREQQNECRLVYADWLEEAGECRQAEYIRLAVARGSAAGDWHWQFWGEVLGLPIEDRRRIFDTTQYTSGGYQSSAPVVSHGMDPAHAHLDRGVAVGLTCSWEYAREHLDAALAVQPVRKVKLTNHPQETLYADDGLPVAPCDTRKHLEHRYPGVEFELPRPTVYYGRNATVTYNAPPSYPSVDFSLTMPTEEPS